MDFSADKVNVLVIGENKDTSTAFLETVFNTSDVNFVKVANVAEALQLLYSNHFPYVLMGNAVFSNLVQDERVQADIERTYSPPKEEKHGIFSNMSHDIRTSLHSILGFAELMLNPHQSKDEQMQSIKAIRRSGEKLLSDLQGADSNITPQTETAKSKKSSSWEHNLLKGVPILVADDAIDNRVLISRFLTHAGARVEFAADGKQAVQKALNGHYKLILMDIQMPYLDGFAATRLLREHGYKEPIIALTAYAETEQKDLCRKVGCTDHLTKPVDRKILLDRVSKLVKPELAVHHH